MASFPAAAADPDLAARLLSSAAERSEPILLPQLVAGGEQHTPGHAASYAPAPHHGSCAWPALRLWQGTDGLQHMARAVGDAPVQVRRATDRYMSLGASPLTILSVQA